MRGLLQLVPKIRGQRQSVKNTKNVKSWDILAFDLPENFDFLHRLHIEASLEASKISILIDETIILSALDFQKSDFFDVNK